MLVFIASTILNEAETVAAQLKRLGANISQLKAPVRA